jgi:hypothetical protein
MQSLFKALLFFVTGLFAAQQVAAHTPHDPVMGLGISTSYAVDKTLVVGSNSERTWGYPDILRSIDAGQTWTNNSANALTVSGKVSGAFALAKEGRIRKEDAIAFAEDVKMVERGLA